MGSRIGLPTATTGALAELVVAADLLRRGFEVYRAVSPAAKSDLVIVRDGRILRVQVKTTYRRANGKLMGRCRATDALDPSEVWAFVVHGVIGSEIAYDGLTE